MSLKKNAIDVVGILVYTLLVSQLTLMMREPVVVREYIKVEVPVYQEVVEEVEEVVEEASVINEKEWLRNIPLSEELQKYTWDLANQYDIDYNLVLGVMYQESRFNPNATNKNKNGTTDKGLMQLNSQYESWHKELTEIKNYDPFNPYHNIHAGIAILNDYRHHWINKGVTSQEKLFKYTVNSYNMGVGSYTKVGLISRSYDRNVLEYKMQLEQEGGI